MITKEQLKNEIRKRFDELSGYDFKLLNEVFYTILLHIYIWLDGLWKAIVLEFDGEVIRRVYMRLIASRIVREASLVDVLKKEELEDRINEVYEMFIRIFPQHMWKEALEKIDEEIKSSLNTAMEVYVITQKGK